MVAGCPKCKARYRVEAARIGPDGAKLRCTKCSAVFLVRAPQEAPAPPRPPVLERVDPPEVESKGLILVADPEESRGKATADAIEHWGLDALLVHDGVEAMLAIQRSLPSVVILDAGLSKMFGFQVCEIVKRNESLRHTKVVLVGAIHHQDRYRRDPSDLYGADVYIEGPDLPEGLLPHLREWDLSIQEPEVDTAVSAPSPVGPSFSTESAPDPSMDPSVEAASLELTSPVVSPAPAQVREEPLVEPVAEPIAEPIEAEDPERTAERERAQRLARIAVSEMVLYQPEKFDQAARAGTLEQTLDLEIQEARALLRQRIGEEVRAEADFIIDELSRVAQERGGQG
jgi:predicted Zn finger-like uncharacterized protein